MNKNIESLYLLMIITSICILMYIIHKIEKIDIDLKENLRKLNFTESGSILLSYFIKMET